MFDWVLNTSFEMRMEIYQKNTRFDFIHKRLLGRILGPRQFECEINIKNTKRRMSGTYTYREHLQYIEKESKAKHIFFTHANFSNHGKIL